MVPHFTDLRAGVKGNHGPPGITLVEVLLVIAIISILLALSVGVLRTARTAGRDVRTLSDTRQIAGAISMYASQAADRPPVVFPRPSVWPEEIQTVMLGGERVQGTWFTNGEAYHRLIEPLLPVAMLTNGDARSRVVSTSAGNAVDWSPYRLTDTFFAGIDYWIPARQRPLAAWGAQTTDSVSIPSQKGMVILPFYVSSDATGPSQPPLIANPHEKRFGARSVAWFDLSASSPRAAELKPGIANRFRWGMNPAATTEYDSGPTVLNTLYGLAGVDR